MTPRLRIWGSAVRIRSGAPFSETFRAIRTAIARRKVPMGDWAGTQADGSVSGAADYESGGQEFESLRARQHLAPTFRAKNTAILRNLQGTDARASGSGWRNWCGGSRVSSVVPRRATMAGYLRLSMRQFSVLAKLPSGSNLTFESRLGFPSDLPN